MEIVMLAGFLGGVTTTFAVFQMVITGNLIWIWLLTLNIIWFLLCIWGATLVENDQQYIKPKQETDINKVPKSLRDVF